MRYLIRQGEGAAGIQRHHEQLAVERQKLERLIGLAQTVEPTPTGRKLIGYRSSEGDRQRMRAIPVIAEGVGGTIPGTEPLAALIAKQRLHPHT